MSLHRWLTNKLVMEDTVEVYPEVKHGFAVNDTPAYDRPAS
jgi:hypothetical protein